MNNVGKFFSYLVAKITSARVIMAILVTATLCGAVNKCFDLIMQVLENTDKELLIFVKEIVMFILGGFMTLVTAISTLYFARNDRQKPEIEEEIK